MKFRSTLLLGATFLIAAMPAFGDSVAYPGSVEEFRNVASAEKGIEIQGPVSNAPVDAEFLTRPAFEIFPAGNPKANTVLDYSSVKPRLDADTFVTTESNNDFHTTIFTVFDSFDRAPSFTHDGLESRRAKRGHDHDGGNGGSDSPLPVSVPEPGSLALSLIGLIGIGFLAQRRGISRDV